MSALLPLTDISAADGTNKLLGHYKWLLPPAVLLGVLSGGTCRRIEQQGVSCFQTHILLKQFLIFFCQIFCSSAYRTISSYSLPHDFVDQILSLFHVKLALSSLTRLDKV